MSEEPLINKASGEVAVPAQHVISEPTTKSRKDSLRGFFKNEAGGWIVWKVVVALVVASFLFIFFITWIRDSISSQVTAVSTQIKVSKKVTGKCKGNTKSATDIICATGMTNKGVTALQGSGTATAKKKACCENTCLAKDADVTKARKAWTKHRCVVENPTATTVTGLGKIQKCTITCPKTAGKFKVAVKGPSVNTCLAMNADVAKARTAWTNQGCVVEHPTATTVTGLGTISVDTKYTGKCNITCPAGGQFKVTGPISKVMCSGNKNKPNIVWGVNIPPSKWSTTNDFICPSGKVLKTGADTLTLTRPKKAAVNQFEDQCCDADPKLVNCTLEKFYKGIGIPPAIFTWTAAKAGTSKTTGLAALGKPKNWMEDWSSLKKTQGWKKGFQSITNEVCDVSKTLASAIPCKDGKWVIPKTLPACGGH